MKFLRFGIRKYLGPLFSVLCPTVLLSQSALHFQDQVANFTADKGTGTGTLNVSHDIFELAGKFVSAGTYSENTNRQAVVIDYTMTAPVPLPPDTQRLAMTYQFPPNPNNGVKCDLRVILEDRRGLRWAFGTRLSGENSRLLVSEKPALLESRSFFATELGRLDPWLALPLGEGQGAYDLPQPPLKFAGLRVVAEAAAPASFDIGIASISALTAEDHPDEYWLLTPATDWTVRSQNEKIGGNFGWGPMNGSPFLYASDLKLPAGSYKIDWEILDPLGWRSLAAGLKDQVITGATDKIAFGSLLPRGTYFLRVSVKRPDEMAFRNFFLRYVVIRNTRTPVIPESSSSDRAVRIVFEGEDSPVFSSGEAPVIKAHVAGAPGPSLKLNWSVESADKRVLSQGTSNARDGVAIQLDEWSEKEAALWITVRLLDEGKEVAIGFRKVGFQSVSREVTRLAPAREGPSSLAGQFVRTKGDASEGESPVATKSEKYRELFGPWIAEAKVTGYNVVELPAPWYDLNPLPGVYQFGYLDSLVDAAAKLNLKVVLRVHPLMAFTPSWLPQEYQEDTAGSAHGLWNGSNALIASPSSVPFREYLCRYLEALSRHFRGNPAVYGYVLEGLFYDHDLAEQPWVGQTVDYSELARVGFIEFLRKRYQGNLEAVGREYQQHLTNWTEIAPPQPKISLDKLGRLEPRVDRAWIDWMDYKQQALQEVRLGGLEALRRGDPDCWVGLYTSETAQLFLDQIAAKGGWLLHGSMEAMFPPEGTEIHGRFEPHSKSARTSALVDIGMSNILMAAPPGYFSFFNYWNADWRLKTLPPLVRDAEDRLHQWFSVVDNLMGAKFAGHEKNPQGGYLNSFDLQRTVFQNFFDGRIDDYIKPLLFRAESDKVRLQKVNADLDHLLPSDHPYLYVPCAMVELSSLTQEKIAAYVKAGGRLILEASSGYWSDEAKATNTLPGLFGLPEATPIFSPPSLAEKANWTADSPVQKVPLEFRTAPYLPPINAQPVSWLHAISQTLLRPYRIKGPLPQDARVLARFSDESPAAVAKPFGLGEVLFLCGAVDWIESAGLASALNDWGNGREVSRVAGNPEILVRSLVKDDKIFLVGRRFVDGEQIRTLKNLKAGTIPTSFESAIWLKAYPEGIPSSPARYHFRELIEQKDCGEMSLAEATEEGISLELKPGQAFLIEATPIH